MRNAGPVLEWVPIDGGDPIPIALHADCVPELSRTRNRTVEEAADFVAGDRRRGTREALDNAVGCTEWFPAKRFQLDSAAKRTAAAEKARNTAEASAAQWKLDRDRAVKSERGRREGRGRGGLQEVSTVPVHFAAAVAVVIAGPVSIRRPRRFASTARRRGGVSACGRSRSPGSGTSAPTTPTAKRPSSGACPPDCARPTPSVGRRRS